MIRTLLTTTAVAALLGTAVIAQDAAPAPDAEAPATTEAPATDAPATDAPATDAPATDAPATDAPDTDAPDTDAPDTDLDDPATDLDDPALDDDAAPADDVTTDLTDVEPVESGAPQEVEVHEPWDISQGYVAVDSDNLVSELMGSSIYSSTADDAENIGNVSDLVFSEDGRLVAVIIGVGGFLGIGEKPVAADFNALEFVLAADGTERWVLPTTSEALEAAPEFVWRESEPITDPAMAPADGMAPADPALAPADPAPVQ